MRSRLAVLAQLAFVAVFVLLIVSNYRLRQQLQAARSAPPIQPFRAGELLPQFAARDAAGRSVTLGGKAQDGTLLILYAPDCDSCRTLLGEIAKKPSQRIALVSVLPRERARSKSHEVAGKVPVYFAEKIQQSPIARRAHVVPQILRIGRGGRIDEVCRSYTACVRSLG